MKKVLLLSIAFLNILSNAISQENPDATTSKDFRMTAVYANVGFDILDDINRGGIGVNVLFSNNWGASFCVNALNRDPKNLPQDYLPGYFFGFKIGSPDDEHVFYSLRSYYTLPISPRIRFGLESGMSYGQHTIIHYVHKPTYRPNYSTWESKNETVGISFCAKIEFMISRFIGFEVSAFGDINRQQSVLGSEFRFTVGLLRDRAEQRLF